MRCGMHQQSLDESNKVKSVGRTRHYTWLELDGKEEIGGTSKIFSSYMMPFSMTEGLYTYLVLVGVYTSEKSL